MVSLEFLLTSLVVVLLPGTGVIYTLAYGLGQGLRASIIAAFGCTLGIIPSAFAAIIGLSAILHTSAVVFQTIKFLGVLYLFYMAWGLYKNSGPLKLQSQDKMLKPSKIILDGALLNALNPKLSLFFLAFLPQFTSNTVQAPILELTMLAGIFMLMTFLIFIVYGVFASYARDYVISKPNVMKWIRNSFAASFGLLGLRLAFSSEK
ncbi:MAG: LysE family translocator [Lentilitoribacter sp.]